MKFLFRIILVVGILVSAGNAYAATSVTTKAKAKVPVVLPFEVSGWIPYWRKATGTIEALAHLGSFAELSPFGYTVKNNGELYDAMGLDAEPWPQFIASARAAKVKLFPTVMWSNGDTIHAVLKSPTLRKAHIASIVSEVNARGWDGVDIDYEAKKAETKIYFSRFLRELAAALGPHKLLSCTIEARTPLDSRYTTPPKTIEYANDFAAIGTYCDRVRIMAYDQGTIDLKLNKTAVGPYVPVADPAWVEKTIRLAMKSIPKRKIVLGVATYGYEYTVTPVAGGAYVYDRETAFNPKYALDIASAYGLTPTRTKTGEMALVYVPTSTPLVAHTFGSISAVPSQDTSSFGVSTVTSSTGTTTPQAASAMPFRLLWWSDAGAIADKIALAKRLGLRGIAIFKLDGGADPVMWNVLK
jgi:spore germination protein YaaH